MTTTKTRKRAPRRAPERSPASEQPPAAKAPQGGLYRPVMTDEELFANLGRLREEARIEIERLINFLDETEGDSDFEPSFGYLPPGVADEAEPEACFERTHRETGSRGQTSDTMQPGDGTDDDEDTHDREAVDEDGDELDAGEFDTADDEPSLGWPEARGVGGAGSGYDYDGEQTGEPRRAIVEAARERWQNSYADPVGDVKRQLRQRVGEAHRRLY